MRIRRVGKVLRYKEPKECRWWDVRTRRWGGGRM